MRKRKHVLCKTPRAKMFNLGWVNPFPIRFNYNAFYDSHPNYFWDVGIERYTVAYSRLMKQIN